MVQLVRLFKRECHALGTEPDAFAKPAPQPPSGAKAKRKNSPVLVFDEKQTALLGKICGVFDLDILLDLGNFVRQKLLMLVIDLEMETLTQKEQSAWDQNEISLFKETERSADILAGFLSDLNEDEHNQISENIIEYDAELLPDILSEVSKFAKNHLVILEEKYSKRKRTGRPSQMVLRNFILSMALTYEKYSKRRFTFDRFNSAREYEPITDGHRFVWTIIGPAIPLLTPEYGVTSTSVAMECEKAVKFRRSLRKFSTKRNPEKRG